MKKLLGLKSMLLLGILACAPALQAGPQINVGVVYDYLDGDKGTYLKRVFNAGDSTAFVRISIMEIFYDEQGNISEQPLKDRGDSSKDGLIASPARLIVPANGMQSTRLLFLGDRSRERYFRVRFVPVMPEKEDEFAVSEQERAEYKEKLTAGVNVLAGYGTVFFVRPNDTKFNSVIDNSAQQYRIRNNGNTVVVVDEFKDCAINSETDCAPTLKHHIMAGHAFEFNKQPGRHYLFTLVEGAKQTKMDIRG